MKQLPLINGVKAVPLNNRIIFTDKSKFIIKFPYDKNLVDEVRKLPARKYDPTTKTWSIPISQAAIDSIKALVLNQKFYLEQTAATAMKKLEQLKRTNAQEATATTASLEIDGLHGQLYPFQQAGVRYALRNKKVFIADEMGLGKTIEALATIQAAHAYPAIVVCPATLKLNWEAEVANWLPQKSCQRIEGRSSDVHKADITILNYEILQYYTEKLKKTKPQAVVFDEAHYLKNHKSIRTKEAKKLARAAKYRIALTGTPIVNRPNELLTQLQVLGRLQDFGGFWHFAERYCDMYQGVFGMEIDGASNLIELHELLQQTCYIRRTKEAVLKELPDKQRAMMPVPINYKDYIGDENLFLSHARKMPAKAGVIEMNELKLKAARLKLPAILDWVKTFIEEEPLVIFAHHIEIQKALLKAFPQAAHILGSDSMQERTDNITRFQTDPNTNLIICSIKAAGVGITLTKASNVAFVEFGWTPAEHDQAEDRCHRIGQKSAVTAWYFIAKNTIDEAFAEVIEKKRAIVNQVTDGKESSSVQTYNAVMQKLIQRRKHEATRG